MKSGELTNKILNGLYTSSELIRMVIDLANKADNVYKNDQEEIQHKLTCIGSYVEAYYSCEDIEVKSLITIFSKSIFPNESVLQINIALSQETINKLSSSDICFIKKHLNNSIFNLESDEEAYIVDLHIIKSALDHKLATHDEPEIRLYGLLE